MSHPTSSRQRYREFVEDYKHRRLDDVVDAIGVKKGAGEPPNNGQPPVPAASKNPFRGKRREYLREYMRWLWPHRYRVGVVFAFALVAVGI